MSSGDGKLYKTRLLEWVPEDRSAYIDADVIIGGPLEKWWRAVHQMRQARYVLLFAAPGHGEAPWHTGVLVVERSSCAYLFRRWQAALLATRDSSLLLWLQGGRDQRALAMVLDSEDVGVLKADDLMMPGRDEIQNLECSTFTHITHTYRRRLATPTRMRRYLREGPRLTYMPVSRFDIVGYCHPLGVRLGGLVNRLNDRFHGEAGGT